MGKRVMVVDVGAVSKYSAFSMMSGGEPIVMGDHKKEAVRRFAKLVKGQACLHRADIVIFAHDTKPYWRSDFLSAWYADHAQHAKVNDTTFLLRYDTTTYQVDNGEVTKLTQPMLKQLPDMEWGPLPKEMVPFMPKYKGNREGKKWPLAEVSPEDLHLLTQEACIGLAARLNGLVVSVPGWEADDIAAVYCKEAPDYVDAVILVTLDSDWYQLLMADHRVKISDIRLGIDLTQDNIPEQKHLLRAKIVGGDRGDGICGTPKSKAQNYSKDAALEVTKDGMPDGLSMPELERNAMLIRLPCPAWDTAEMYGTLKEHAVRPVEVEGEWEKLFVTQRDLAEMENDALVEGWLRKIKGDVQPLTPVTDLLAEVDKVGPVAGDMKDEEANFGAAVEEAKGFDFERIRG